MLEPQPYPVEKPSLRKHDVLRDQAKQVGFEGLWSVVPQTTAWREQVNAAGVRLRGSTLSGQDCTGLNDASKNTVLTTYVADAWSFGAEIFCGCDVRYVRRHPQEGYLVYFDDLTSRSAWWPFSRRATKLHWVHARKLAFLGAGSLGSTEIMLRSKKHGLPLSPKVGTRIGANGGLLAFGYGLNRRVNSVGEERPSKDPPGPTISSMIDCRSQVNNVREGFVIQEGTFPTPMAALFRLVKAMLPAKMPMSDSMLKRAKRFWQLCNPLTKAVEYSQVYLVMGHDNAAGTMRLLNDSPILDMRNLAPTAYLQRAKSLLSKMTFSMGGTFLESGCKVTAHPLGGLPLAADGTGKTGAANQRGELFTGEGIEMHKGLCVVDGSAVPTSLGANPLATICAIAERSVQLMVDSLGLSLDLGQNAEYQKRWEAHQASTPLFVQFAEQLTGCCSINGHTSELDLDLFVKTGPSNDGFEGTVHGTLACSSMSSDQLNISHGTFVSVAKDPSASCQLMMCYNFTAVSSAGETYNFRCRKTITPSVMFSPSRLWRSATSVSVEIDTVKPCCVGAGRLSISAPAVMDMVRSMHASGSSESKRCRIMLRYLWFFAGRLAEMFFAPFAPLQRSFEVQDLVHQALKAKPARTSNVFAADGVHTSLRVWQPQNSSGSKAAIDILFISGSATNHMIFANPFVNTNAIDYFTRRGYRCWCLTPRFGKQDDETARSACTAYDARLDIAAALLEIERYTSQVKPKPYGTPYVVAHCAGALALACALLDGTVRSSSILGMTASQSFLTPVLGGVNSWKAKLPLNRLYQAIAGGWFACDPGEHAGFVQQILDQVLRFYPVGPRREICNSVACHRGSLAYGRMWNHRNLNAATHSRLHKFFGGVHTRCMEHLALCGVRQTVLDAQGRSLVSERNLQRLRGLRIFLFTGGDNVVYDPESTVRSWELLSRMLRKEKVGMKIFDGVGHLDAWMGDKGVEKGGIFETIEAEIGHVVARSL